MDEALEEAIEGATDRRVLEERKDKIFECYNAYTDCARPQIDFPKDSKVILERPWQIDQKPDSNFQAECLETASSGQWLYCSGCKLPPAYGISARN